MRHSFSSVLKTFLKGVLSRSLTWDGKLLNVLVSMAGKTSLTFNKKRKCLDEVRPVNCLRGDLVLLLQNFTELDVPLTVATYYAVNSYNSQLFNTPACGRKALRVKICLMILQLSYSLLLQQYINTRGNTCTLYVPTPSRLAASLKTTLCMDPIRFADEPTSAFDLRLMFTY